MTACLYCDAPAARGPLCELHRKRRQRAQVLSLPVRERYQGWSRVVECAIGLADASAEDDREFERAADRLRKAALAYAHELEATRSAGGCG